MAEPAVYVSSPGLQSEEPKALPTSSRGPAFCIDLLAVMEETMTRRILTALFALILVIGGSGAPAGAQGA